ncbi:hypothetical protein F5B22DRAFT_640628 [Xylaria bambusicola]|uniref:uncharacterized protein n=1 Tax=Xylaria bambusicola TaxID=326684 RepID=UPI002007741F|nr:uncharacterized protein F5B22DRAFT_640628 [Xylaria bambusicola]KAI0502804.1 hypothetical protein F5B22DRAFT_640628 [Xylaria bambusicola]
MAPVFYNLPDEAALDMADSSLLPLKDNVQSVHTNWFTFGEETLSSESIQRLLENRIPVVREKQFLTAEECRKLLEITKTHEISEYFDNVENARSLQARWKTEAGIDIVHRIAEKLHEITGIPVEIAQDGGREYFAGMVRASDAGIDVHADWAPYEAPAWAISKISRQLTWNILLNEVPGGETIIYDRQWRAPEDDLKWRPAHRTHSYQKRMLEGRPFKVMPAVPGDLTFFSPRNFHEVLPCETSSAQPTAATRFTVSSMVGLKPAQGSEPAKFVLWS